MASRRSTRETAPKSEATSNQSLRHVLVVGGHVDEWDGATDEEWGERIERTGQSAVNAGVRWVTLLPYGPSADRACASTERRVIPSGETDVIIEPHADGRERFAAALRTLPQDAPVNEATVAEVLYEPADSEPDLVVVYGPSTELPPSLVWELAYAELVFTEAAWSAPDERVLATAFADFASRRRRFGGLDD